MPEGVPPRRLGAPLSLAALALLAAAAVVFWPEGAGELGPADTDDVAAEAPPELADVRVEESGSRIEEDTQVAGGATASGEPSDAPAAEASAQAWQFRVVDELGAPVAGVEVAIVQMFRQPLVSTGLTDRDGLCAVPKPAGVRNWQSFAEPYLAVARIPGFVTARTEIEAADDPPEEAIELQVATATASQPVQLRFAHDGSVAAELALVLIGAESTAVAHTDANGIARLPGSGEQEHELYLSAPGFRTRAPRPLKLRVGENPSLPLEVTGIGNRAHLLAVDAVTGEAIESTRWLLNSGEELGRGAELNWQEENLPGTLRFARFMPSAVAPGYLDQQAQLNEPPGAEPVRVELLQLTTLELDFVLTQAGEPLARENFDVTAFPPAEAGIARQSAPRVKQRTDPEGRLRVALDWAASFGFPERIRLQHPELFRFGIELHTEKLGPQPWHLDVEPPTGTLRVEFRDSEGRPLAGQVASVWLQTTAEAPLFLRAQGQPGRPDPQTSAEDGVAEIQIPVGISYFWQHQVAGEYVGRALEWAAPLQAGEVRVIRPVVQGSLEISGHCVFPRALTRMEQDRLSIGVRLLQADGRPIPRSADGGLWSRAQVKMGGEDDNLDPFNQASPGDPGPARRQSFRFANVPDGDYLLALDLDGEPLVTQAVRAGDTGVEFKLPEPCQLRLRLQDRDSGELVTSDGFFLINGQSYGVATAGRAEMLYFPVPGTRLEWDFPGYGRSSLALPTEVRPGAIVEQTVELDQGRTLTLDCDNPAALAGREFNWRYVGADGQRLSLLTLDATRAGGSWTCEHMLSSAFSLGLFERTDQDSVVPLLTLEIPAGQGPYRTSFTLPPKD